MIDERHYLTPVANTIVEKLVEQGFEYGGTDDCLDPEEILGNYKGWAIEAFINLPLDGAEDFTTLAANYVSLIWLQTKDYWSKDCGEDFSSEEEAVNYAMQLIDLAEAKHKTSLGNFRVF